MAARTVDQVLYMVTSNADGVEGGSRAISLRLNDPKAPAVGAQVDFPGDGKQILVTPTALVVASVSPFNPTDTRVQFFSTAIDGNLLVRGFIDVPGEPMGRFHMDLAGNYFRIVTFERNKSNSRLTILDVTDPDHMKEAGSLPQIGSGQLYATRFDGDRAYVITFRRTDPLYIISLKDPTRPEILGQLEIPDWSDFLFPRGDRLIGVGRGGGGSFVGLTLFDVSDPTRPRGIQQIQINTRSVSTSEATLDYRGLTIVDDGADPYIALPWSTVTFKTDDKTRTLCTVESWLQVVDIGALGFTRRGKASQIGPVLRSFVAGANKNRLVSISDFEIKSLDVTDRDALSAEFPLTVGTKDGIQDTIRATCEDAKSRWYGGLYACNVGAKDPARNTGMVLLAIGAIGLARRRRSAERAGRR